LIGKGGTVINKVRQDSGCRIDIHEGIPGAKQRVVTVSGPHQSVANCLHSIADRLHERSRGSDVATAGEYTTYEVKSSGEVGIESCHLILLIPNNQVGAIIGKAGAKVNSTRSTSGAQIKISEKPIGDSTEKTVTIVGSSKAVHTALLTICSQLNDESDKVATIPYIPRPDYGHSGSGYNTYVPSQYDDYPPRRGEPLPRKRKWPPAPGPDDDYRPSSGWNTISIDPYGPPPSRGPPPQSRYPPSGPGTQTLVVPVADYLMATVIGKKGSSINEIRARSGAHIKIAALESGATDRMITLTGTPQANELAIAMIHQKMAEYTA